MKFNSIYGEVTGIPFQDAIFTGFTPKGGMLMPETIPQLKETEIEAMRSMSYTDIVKEVSSKFISEDEIPRSDLNDLIDAAFAIFPPGNDLIPLVKLRDDLAVLEMFHGPTLAFKDYGMSCLAQFIKYFLKKHRQRAVCVVATSGDTGSAALEAFKNLELIDIIVLLPKDGCSPIQELQMTTVCGNNTHVIRAEGTSDDLDVVMKAILLDEDLRSAVRLFSVNSINFGRMLIQTAHHIYAYFRASEVAKDVEIVVPSGALGNITSGCIAQAMGFPLKFILCTNINDIAHQMIASGTLKVPKDVIPSCANAMNIQRPYNVSRLLWIFSGCDTDTTKSLSTGFDVTDFLDVPSSILEKMRRVIVGSQCVADTVVLDTILKCWKRNSYVVCPHTACGLAYCLDKPHGSVMRVVIATASPAKFPEVVNRAGVPFDDLLTQLKTKEQKYEDWMKESGQEKLLREKIYKIISTDGV